MNNNDRFFQPFLSGIFTLKLMLSAVSALFLLTATVFPQVSQPGGHQASAAGMTKTAAFPALQGKAAVDHLKQQGLFAASGNALHAAISANYTELTEMYPADLVDQAYFGSATAISGNTLVVGAPHLFGSGSDFGTVYIFVRSGDIFTQQAKLTGLRAWDEFGTSVALDGNTLVVGAPGYNFSSTPVTGRAHVYVRTGAAWTLQDTLTEGFLIESYGFGNSVAINGETAVVGHSYDNIGTNNAQGSAYVFVRSGTHWNKQQKLLASDGATSDKFGTSVAISQNTILVGASRDTTGNNQSQGSAYVFTRSATTWNQQQKLTASDGMQWDYFGYSVALDSDTAVIGAPQVNDHQGAAYVFTRSGSSWSQQQKITVSDLSVYGDFGFSVALQGGTMVIGAPSDWFNDQHYRGSAYVFTLSGAIWSQQQKLTDNTGYESNYFGTSVALDADTILIGASRKNQEKGAAVAFGLPPNNPPTITPFLNVSRAAGSVGLTATIASVNDAEDAENALQITVNGGASSQVGAVTLSNLSVGAGGNVTATISTFCTPLLPSIFTLRVTDSVGAFTETTLTVSVTANTAPVLSYSNPQSVSTGGATTINPATGPSDNGTVNSVVVQSVTPAFSGSITVNSSGVVSVSNAGPAGSYSVTIRATDACGLATNATFTLNVASNCPVISISPTLLPNSSVGQVYDFTMTALGGAAPYSFSLDSGTLPGGLQLASNGNLSGTLTSSGTFNFTMKVTDANGCMMTRGYNVTINPVINPIPGPMQFYPLAHPVRLLDTRVGASGCDAPGAKIAGGTSRHQTAAGRTCDGLTLPANAAALIGNVTTVQSGGGYLTLYPSDIAKPLAANSNYAANQILNNVFTVRLGANDGAFKIFVSTDTDVVVDITGYYAPPAAGGLYFHPLPKPVRLLDTRAGAPGCFTPGQILQANSTMTQLGQTTCDGVLIPAGVQAMVGNATTTNQQANGYMTMYPADAVQPLAASSNFQTGINMNAPFMVGLSPSGEFNIFTAATTDLVIDVLGYYSTQLNDANGQGLLFNSLAAPVRLLDTRAGQSACFTPGAQMIAAGIYDQPATGACTTIPAAAQSVVGNATTVNATANGYLTFWPSDAPKPLIATSNYQMGQVFNRHFTVGLGADGAFKRLSSKTTDLVIDLSGYFAP